MDPSHGRLLLFWGGRPISFQRGLQPMSTSFELYRVHHLQHADEVVRFVLLELWGSFCNTSSIPTNTLHLATYINVQWRRCYLLHETKERNEYTFGVLRLVLSIEGMVLYGKQRQDILHATQRREQMRSLQPSATNKPITRSCVYTSSTRVTTWN